MILCCRLRIQSGYVSHKFFPVTIRYSIITFGHFISFFPTDCLYCKCFICPLYSFLGLLFILFTSKGFLQVILPFKLNFVSFPPRNSCSYKSIICIQFIFNGYRRHLSVPEAFFLFSHHRPLFCMFSKYSFFSLLLDTVQTKPLYS